MYGLAHSVTVGKGDITEAFAQKRLLVAHNAHVCNIAAFTEVIAHHLLFGIKRHVAHEDTQTNIMRLSALPRRLGLVHPDAVSLLTERSAILAQRSRHTFLTLEHDISIARATLAVDFAHCDSSLFWQHRVLHWQRAQAHRFNFSTVAEKGLDGFRVDQPPFLCQRHTAHKHSALILLFLLSTFTVAVAAGFCRSPSALASWALLASRTVRVGGAPVLLLALFDSCRALVLPPPLLLPAAPLPPFAGLVGCGRGRAGLG
mmetsp:Transcript_64468/g.104320  ORF Transcript_64468/g.104320 Transcript_64468/m.104320 type:complete len:259 (+) Transcript_64468:974-1750(+)